MIDDYDKTILHLFGSINQEIRLSISDLSQMIRHLLIGLYPKVLFMICYFHSIFPYRNAFLKNYFN